MLQEYHQVLRQMVMLDFFQPGRGNLLIINCGLQVLQELSRLQDAAV